jgi:DNA-binding transcriptional MerR regulator
MKKQTDIAEKSYNRCLSCPHRTVRCNGPRTSDLPLDRWCEYMRDMKQVNKLTNAYISEKSGVSLKTIERIMALNSEQDIMRDTARRLESVIIGSERAYPCYLAFQEENMPGHQQLNDVRQELEHALVENSGYKTALENIHASYKSELETVRAEAQEKIDYLKDLVAKLRADNDNLWKENIRKSKIVDMFLERQNTGS